MRVRRNLRRSGTGLGAKNRPLGIGWRLLCSGARADLEKNGVFRGLEHYRGRPKMAPRRDFGINQALLRGAQISDFGPKTGLPLRVR